jgi:hypothetical protein
MNNSPDPQDDRLLNFLKSLKAKVSQVFHEASKTVRIQVERKGRREGIANSQEWAEIASRKKAIAERA